MPRKPLRPCSFPGCPRLCEGRYCDEHRIHERRRYDSTERSADVNKTYGRKWRKIRAEYAKAHPLCERCLKDGKLVPVEEVHHILPVKWGGTHDFGNLMSLCQSCHTELENEIGSRGVGGSKSP